jgi:hypothetical protein
MENNSEIQIFKKGEETKKININFKQDERVTKNYIIYSIKTWKKMNF